MMGSKLVTYTIGLSIVVFLTLTFSQEIFAKNYFKQEEHALVENIVLEEEFLKVTFSVKPTILIYAENLVIDFSLDDQSHAKNQRKLSFYVSSNLTYDINIGLIDVYANGASLEDGFKFNRTLEVIKDQTATNYRNYNVDVFLTPYDKEKILINNDSKNKSVQAVFEIIASVSE